MSYLRTSFTYDPSRQGIDANSWRVLQGLPTLVGGKIALSSTQMISYADVLKGDFTFNVSVPDAPGGGDDRTFGLYNLANGAFCIFRITDTLTCQVSDGVNTATSSTVVWDTTWNGTSVPFRMVWQAGLVIFSVNGTRVASISDTSVPSGALALYLKDFSPTGATVGSIDVRGTQSYVLNPKTSDTTTYDGVLLAFQAVTVSENISILQRNYTPTFFDSVTVAESVTVLLPTLKFSLFDAVTTAEHIN